MGAVGGAPRPGAGENLHGVQASPSRPAAVLAVTLAILMLAAAAIADSAGALLLVSGALLLLVLAMRDLALRPVLTADGSGLTVVDGWHRVTASWQEVEGLRVVVDRRAALLEVDLGEVVVVLTRRRLGRAPYAVLDELAVLRGRPS